MWFIPAEIAGDKDKVDKLITRPILRVLHEKDQVSEWLQLASKINLKDARRSGLATEAFAAIGAGLAEMHAIAFTHIVGLGFPGSYPALIFCNYVDGTSRRPSETLFKHWDPGRLYSFGHDQVRVSRLVGFLEKCCDPKSVIHIHISNDPYHCAIRVADQIVRWFTTENHGASDAVRDYIVKKYNIQKHAE